MQDDVRTVLLELSKVVGALQSRVSKDYLRLRALQIVVAQATGRDLRSAEESLEKIEETLKPRGEQVEQISTIIELLGKGKSPIDLDS